MGRQQDDKRNRERGEETRRPGEWRKMLFFFPLIGMGKLRILAGLVDHIAAVQEHGGLEQSMRDEMEYRQRERA